ncbi:hypothetical protein ACFU3O_24470 [Streptomyces antibioticus]
MAVRLVRGSRATSADVLAATDSVAPALEIADGSVSVFFVRRQSAPHSA